MAVAPREKQQQPGGEGAERELKLAFARLARRVVQLRGRDSHIRAPELTTAQYELLAQLDLAGPSSAGELAAAADLSPGTVTQMLDHLANAGHVERVRSLEDRRVVVSDLTDAGRAALARKRECWQARWEEALAELSERDVRAAARVMQRLAVMLDEVAEDRGPAAGT